jgi:hypothetical protein
MWINKAFSVTRDYLVYPRFWLKNIFQKNKNESKEIYSKNNLKYIKKDQIIKYKSDHKNSL